MAALLLKLLVLVPCSLAVRDEAEAHHYLVGPTKAPTGQSAVASGRASQKVQRAPSSSGASQKVQRAASSGGASQKVGNERQKLPNELVVDGGQTSWQFKIKRRAEENSEAYTSLFIAENLRSGSATLKAMASNSGLKQLKRVEIGPGNFPGAPDLSGLQALQNLKDLKFLFIRGGNDLRPDGTTALAKALAHCEGLSELYIGSYNNIGEEGAKAFQQLYNKHRKGKLVISINAKGNDVNTQARQNGAQRPKVKARVKRTHGIDGKAWQNKANGLQDVLEQHEPEDAPDHIIYLEDDEDMTGDINLEEVVAQRPEAGRGGDNALQIVDRNNGEPYDWEAVCKQLQRDTNLARFSGLIIQKNVKISGDKLKALLDTLPPLKSVKILGDNDISRSRGVRTDDGFEALGNLKYLEELLIGGGNHLLDNGAELFQKALEKAQADDPRLRVLVVGGDNKLAHAGAQAIAKITSLTHLSIAEDNYLGTEGTKALAQLTKLKSVQLGANNLIGEDGLSGVKALAGLPELETLAIYKAGNGKNATTELTVEQDSDLLSAISSGKLELV